VLIFPADTIERKLRGTRSRRYRVRLEPIPKSLNQRIPSSRYVPIRATVCILEAVCHLAKRLGQRQIYIFSFYLSVRGHTFQQIPFFFRQSQFPLQIRASREFEEFRQSIRQRFSAALQFSQIFLQGLSLHEQSRFSFLEDTFVDHVVNIGIGETGETIVNLV